MRRDRIMREYLRHRMVITMKNNATWDGVVMDADERTISLRDVSAVQADGSRVSADGDVLLSRADIAYSQFVPTLPIP